MGFSRPWGGPVLPAPLGGLPKRDYKVVSVGQDGKVRVVTMRHVG